MMVMMVIMGYAILIIYEFVPLYKEQKWVDFWVNAFLCSISFTMSVLLSLNIKIPSPETPIRQVITALFGK